MKRPGYFVLVLSVAGLMLTTSAALRKTGPSPPTPIGTGARFLPASTALYVAADARSPQWEYVNRLVQFYQGAGEVDEAWSQIDQATGLSTEKLLDEFRAWAGGEVFIAVPDARDLTDLQKSSSRASCELPGVVAGAAIDDRVAFQRFVRELQDEVGATRAVPFPGDAGDIYEIGRDGSGPLLYVVVQDEFALLSTSRELLTGALAQGPRTSLAASPTFGEALRRLGGESLVFAFSQFDAAASGVFPAAGIAAEARPSWFAGALRMGPESARLDVTTAFASDGLGPAVRALLGQSPNPVATASILPEQTSVLVSWHNLKAQWDAIVEAVWPDRADYEQLRADTRESTGLDLDDDIFGWMTGEVALYVAPASVPDPQLGSLGIGLVIEAPDGAEVQGKLDKIVAALSSLEPDIQGNPEQIAGEEFTSFPVPAYGEQAVYLGLVDNWVVVTAGAEAASDVISGIRGAAALNGSPEFRVVRDGLRDPLQFLVYDDIAQAIAMATTALQAAGIEEADVEPFTEPLRPIRSVGFAVNTGVDRADASLFAHIVVPDAPLSRAGGPRSTVVQPRPPAESRDDPCWSAVSNLPLGQFAEVLGRAASLRDLSRS